MVSRRSRATRVESEVEGHPTFGCIERGDFGTHVAAVDMAILSSLTLDRILQNRAVYKFWSTA
jgi:hypothetical protein